MYTCTQPYNGKRFCGEGHEFEGKGSIDCSGCAGGGGQWKGGGKYADFAYTDNYGTIKGLFNIDVNDQPKDKPLPKLVEWTVEGLEVKAALVEKACGKLNGAPDFTYHIHTDWNYVDGRTSSAFDCSLENVGNHWDPTAACGPASGNPVCDKPYCETRGVNYTCGDPLKFDPYSIMQYRLLSPSKLAPDGVTCEFGDLSGMTGPIDAQEDAGTGDVSQNKGHDGQAAMTASFGEIYPETLAGNTCYFGTLPIMGTQRPTYDYASIWSPLDQLPKNASVLVHCGADYENAGARFFCAKLLPHDHH
jgi:hypothetical protein